MLYTHLLDVTLYRLAIVFTPSLEAQVETTAPDIVDGFLSYIPA